MRKGVTSLQNIRLLKWCAEIGIMPSWNLLYGFPGEPPQEYDRMAELIPSLVHLQPPMFIPLELERFSPYFDGPNEFGIEIIGPLPHYRFLYSIPQTALYNLAYDFEYRYSDGRDPAMYTHRVADAVERWREQSKKAAGSLMYRRGPGFIQIEDRRPGLENANYRFDGIEAQIYLACADGATPAEIWKRLRESGAEAINDAAEIEDYLQSLVDARLMYREGPRFLALATAMNAAVTPQLPAQESAPTLVEISRSTY